MDLRDSGKRAFFADLTFGGGGHSLALLNRGKNIFIRACDRDPEAIAHGRELIDRSACSDRIELVHSNFNRFPRYAPKAYRDIFEANGGFHGILLDLGVSTHHLESRERGFSFKLDGPLDMRMDRDNGSGGPDAIPTASDVINESSLDDLERIFRQLGEEFYSKKIVQKIGERRKEKRIESTKELEDIIFHCYPKKRQHGKTHPATKCFQALRIYVNDELRTLSDTIPQLIPHLRQKGRLLIISFHSLEDRIVKRAYKELCNSFPCQTITKRPIRPTQEEIKKNFRSRSAKLRVIERTV